MKKKIITYSVIFAVLYFIETVFCPIRISGISPEYLFLGVIMLSMLENERFGSVYGLIFGLLCDFSSAGVFGMNALIFMAVGYLTGFVTEKFISVNFFSALFLAFCGTVVCSVPVCALYSFFAGESIPEVLFRIAFPKVILCVPCAAALYFIFRTARHFLSRREEREGTW